MAIISRIRKHSGLLVGLIGVSIAGFILQDAFSGRGGNKPPKLAKISGQSINYDAYDAKVEELAANYRRAQGEDIPLSAEDMFQVRQMAWDNMLNEYLLNDACAKTGITVSQKEMNDMYYGQFIHQQVYRLFTNPQTGAFDRQQVMMTFNNFDQLSPEDKKVLADVEKFVKEDRLKSKYYTLVSKSYYVPKAVAAQSAALVSKKAQARATFLSYMSIPDTDVKVEESDYKKYYESHKYMFEQEDSRAIDYVTFSVAPSPEDLVEIENHVNTLYTEMQSESNVVDFVNAESTKPYDSTFKKKSEVRAPWDSLLFSAAAGTTFTPRVVGNQFEFVKLISVQNRPDSLRASHILLSFQGAAGGQSQAMRTKEDAEKIADSLKNIIGKNPVLFAQYAQQMSDDKSNSEKGGDLEWFRDGMMVPEFNDAVIQGNVGDVKVVETYFGYHIIMITGKTAPIKKVRAAFVYVPIEPSNKTTKEAFQRANNFLTNAIATKSFDSAVAKYGLNKRTSEYTGNMDNQLPGLASCRDIVRWAYNEDTKVGAISPEVYKYEDMFAVATLRQIREKGVMSYDEFKSNPQIKYIVAREKKAEQLMTKANADIAKNQNIDALSAAWNSPVDSIMDASFSAYSVGMNGGFEPEVVGRLFGMKDGSMSKAIKGNSGVYVLKLDAMDKPEVTPAYIIGTQMQMMQTFQNQVYNGTNEALKEKANVEDNRWFYY